MGNGARIFSLKPRPPEPRSIKPARLKSISGSVFQRRSFCGPDTASPQRNSPTRSLSGDADGLLELETHIEPEGDFSPYGGVEAYFSAEGEKPVLLRKVDNVAAYIDAKKRRVMAPLGVKALPKGVLKIRYAGHAEFEGRIFAERSFTVGPPSP